jgi:hypothetical protein
MHFNPNLPLSTRSCHSPKHRPSPPLFFQSGSHQGTSIEGKTWTSLIQPSSNLYYAAILDVVAEKLDSRNSGHALAAAESFYCSRACQAAHWKVVHRVSCRQMAQGDQANGEAGVHVEADEAEQALDV